MEGSNSSWNVIDFNKMNDSPGQTCTDGATQEEMDIFDVASWIVEGVLVVVPWVTLYVYDSLIGRAIAWFMG